MSGSRTGAARLLSLTLALVAAATTLWAFEPVPSAVAASPANFSAGSLITDAVFYNAEAMSAIDVQSFLESQVPNCTSGYTCLKDYREDTLTRPADSYCASTVYGVAQQRASDTIKAVATACGINPQVLLVLLQKEQGLVSSTHPSTSAYLRATGYGCPDTAACNAEYFGFSNQVWRAARQFRIYQAAPNNFNHVAGRLNAVRFHPNTACGATQVFIENQATAGLYNYTPYQPNGAALANLYGTGDGCSSYGNRNFWRIFTDWFGNPNGYGTLLRSAGDPTIYLATETRKYPVLTGTLYSSLLALGPYYVTSQAFLDALTTGPNASNLLRNPTDGSIYLAAYGAKNKFLSCAMIAEYGFGSACGTYLDVLTAQLAKFSTGTAVTQFARSSTTGIIYFVNDGTKRALHSAAQMTDLADGGSTAYTNFPEATLGLIPSGPDVLDPGTVVKTSTSPTLYLADADGVLVPIDSGAVYSSFGLGTPQTISTAALAVATVRTAPLRISVTCGAQEYLGGGGFAWPIASVSGLSTTALAAATCDALPAAPQSVTGSTFLRLSTGTIFYLHGGKKQPLTTMAQVNTLNGTAPLVLIPTTQAITDTIPTAPDLLAPGKLVKTATSSIVYFVDGARKVPIASFAIAGEFGSSGYSTVSEVTSAAYPSASSPLTTAVSCGADTLIAGTGKLWKVPTAAGLTVTTFDTTTCAAIPRSSQTVTGAVFLLAPNGYIWYITGGKKQFVPTSARLTEINGADVPLVLIPNSQATIDSIPESPETLGVAKLVKTASNPTLYFVDGSRKIPLSVYAIASEFGISGYSTISAVTSAAYPAATASLTAAVSCGGSTYIAGGGKLWQVPNSGGLTVTALDATTCAALPVSPSVVTGPVFLLAPNGYVWYVSGGKKQFVTTGAKLAELNAGHSLVLIPNSQATLDTIPSGTPL